MIVSSPFDKDLLGHEIRGVNTSYYGLSALQAVINHDGIRQDIAKYMYRDCIVDGGRKGVIIGFEDNNQFFDYYYIVYVPELNTTVYQLANDARFINSIEIGKYIIFQFPRHMTGKSL